MLHNANDDEKILAQLKSQTAAYIGLPFNTGDFLMIAHYKLIAHYSKVLKQAGTQGLTEDDLSKRKELHEEVLFHLHKVLALTLLSDEQLTELRRFKTLHEQTLSGMSGSAPDKPY